MSKEKMLDFGKKIKACLPTRRGSILAYSLIILAMMLAIATSISISTIIEKKGASGTEFSMQSLQTADSGIQLALKKITAASAADTMGNIASSLGGSCSNSKITATGPAGSSYELTFLKEDGTKIACADVVKDSVADITSVGIHNSTARAVSVAVAATGTGGITGGCHTNTTTILAAWGAGCKAPAVTPTGAAADGYCGTANDVGYACGATSNYYCICTKI